MTHFVFFTVFLTNFLKKCRTKSFENIDTLLLGRKVSFVIRKMIWHGDTKSLNALVIYLHIYTHFKPRYLQQYLQYKRVKPSLKEPLSTSKFELSIYDRNKDW